MRKHKKTKKSRSKIPISKRSSGGLTPFGEAKLNQNSLDIDVVCLVPEALPRAAIIGAFNEANFELQAAKDFTWCPEKNNGAMADFAYLHYAKKEQIPGESKHHHVQPEIDVIVVRRECYDEYVEACSSALLGVDHVRGIMKHYQEGQHDIVVVQKLTWQQLLTVQPNIELKQLKNAFRGQRGLVYRWFKYSLRYQLAEGNFNQPCETFLREQFNVLMQHMNDVIDNNDELKFQLQCQQHNIEKLFQEYGAVLQECLPEGQPLGLLNELKAEFDGRLDGFNSIMKKT